MRAKLKTASLVLVSLFLFVGCDSFDTAFDTLFDRDSSANIEVHKWSGQTMGTHYGITVVLPERLLPDDSIDKLPFDLVVAKAAVEQVLTEMVEAMSTYKADSEISRFNQLLEPQCMMVSDAFSDTLTLALDINQASGGAFNPLLGPLVNRWGFGSDYSAFIFPTPDELQVLLKRSDIAAVSLKDQQLCKSAALQLDLSAIAKGYAVDRVADRLTALGAEHYLVDIGGEVKVLGQNASGNAWRLAIEKPEQGLGSVQQVVNLPSGSAIATSGDYRNFFEYQGVRYSHTIDPNTGYPVRHSLTSVSVIASDAALADAWATAFNVMGPEQAKALAEARGLAVYLLTLDAAVEVIGDSSLNSSLNRKVGSKVDSKEHSTVLSYSSWHSSEFAAYLQ